MYYMTSNVLKQTEPMYVILWKIRRNEMRLRMANDRNALWYGCWVMVMGVCSIRLK